ncbi:MAG: tetratricopeptide repeat protein, partial [Pseudomonadota bacterium]
NVPDAWFHPVNGLELTDSADSEAVRVFEFLAKRNQPAFDLNEKLPLVKQICQMVDGLPLALELSASWLKMLSMEEIVDELSQGLDFLEDQFDDGHERQSSVRAVINETWQRLTESERTLLKQFSVFRNGADREAIAKIIGAGLPILARLVNKALLYTGEDKRYRMHELIRQFAEEKLQEDPDFQTETRRNHANYFLKYIDSQLEPMRGPEQGEVCWKTQADFNNLRNAWRWAISQEKYERLGDTLRCLSFFCDLRGHYHEGLDMFNAALKQVESSSYAGKDLLAARIKMRSAILNFRLCRYDSALALFEDVLQHESLEYETTYALRFLGDYHFSHSGIFTAEEARNYLEECIERASQFNNLHIKTECLCQLGILYTNLIIDVDKSRACAEEGLELARKLERPDLLINALDVSAWTTNHRGDYATAESLWYEAFEIAVQSGNRRNKALITNWLGWSAWCVGEQRLDEAYQHFDEALRRYQDIGDRANMSMCCADLSTVLLEQGRYDLARTHCATGIELANQIGRDDHYVYNLYVLGAIDCATGNLQQARINLEKSRAMAWEQEEQTNKPVVVYYITQLLYAEYLENPTQSPAEQLTQIGLILRFLQVYPSTWQAFKDRAKRFQSQIESESGSDPFAAVKRLSETQLIEKSLELIPQLLS